MIESVIESAGEEVKLNTLFPFVRVACNTKSLEIHILHILSLGKREMPAFRAHNRVNILLLKSGSDPALVKTIYSDICH